MAFSETRLLGLVFWPTLCSPCAGLTEPTWYDRPPRTSVLGGHHPKVQSEALSFNPTIENGRDGPESFYPPFKVDNCPAWVAGTL